MYEISGEYNDAKFLLDKNQLEQKVINQVQQVIDHPSSEGAGTIVMQPDCHYGKGAPIGLTMPLGDNVVPNLVGVDVGCGVSWAKLEADDGTFVPEMWNDESWAADVDERVRDAVPMDDSTRSKPALHIVDEFPWEVCENKLDSLLDILGYSRNDLPDHFSGYDGDYFKELCKRVHYDVNRAINSLGSLGGGNHFIEFSRSTQTDDVFVIVHSGSRGIGYAVADYWQDEATEATYNRQASVEVPKSEWKYFDGPHLGEADDAEGNISVITKPGELSPDRDAILEDYEGEAIDGKFGQLRQYMQAGKDDSSPLDYLQGKEGLGYYVDMVFAQTYAAESRRVMLEEAANAMGAEIDFPRNSTHNYIDFDDGVLRKGATPARSGEIAIIPYNMKEGSIVVRGTGDDSVNKSVPHGAGRAMSRTEAYNTLSQSDVDEEMSEVFTTNVPLDEAPASYKDTSMVEEAIQGGEVVDRLVPLQNLKA